MRSVDPNTSTLHLDRWCVVLRSIVRVWKRESTNVIAALVTEPTGKGCRFYVRDYADKNQRIVCYVAWDVVPEVGARLLTELSGFRERGRVAA